MDDGQLPVDAAAGKNKKAAEVVAGPKHLSLYLYLCLCQSGLLAQLEKWRRLLAAVVLLWLLELSCRYWIRDGRKGRADSTMRLN